MNQLVRFDQRSAEQLKVLVKICGLLGSKHAGERAAAAAKADGLVRRLGLTWPDVIRGIPAEHRKPNGSAPSEDGWPDQLRFCREQGARLSDREYDFIANLSQRRYPPTSKQRQWLADIYERLGGRA